MACSSFTDAANRRGVLSGPFMASSTSLPMTGWLAWRWAQRASAGAQKTFSALYSSGSSGFAPA